MFRLSLSFAHLLAAGGCTNSKLFWVSPAFGPSLCYGRKFPQIVLTFGCRFWRIFKTKTLPAMYLLWHKFGLRETSGHLVFLHLLSTAYHWTNTKEILRLSVKLSCFWSRRLEFVVVLKLSVTYTSRQLEYVTLASSAVLNATANFLYLAVQLPYAVFLCSYRMCSLGV